jgi:hypothetical protein
MVIQNFVVIHVFQLEFEIDQANCPCLPTLKKFNDYLAISNIANLKNPKTKNFSLLLNLNTLPTLKI